MAEQGGHRGVAEQGARRGVAEQRGRRGVAEQEGCRGVAEQGGRRGVAEQEGCRGVAELLRVRHDHTTALEPRDRNPGRPGGQEEKVALPAWREVEEW